MALKIRNNNFKFIVCYLVLRRTVNKAGGQPKLVLKLNEEEVRHEATFIVISGDLKFAQTNWGNVSSMFPYENAVLGILVETGFMNFLPEKMKQMNVFLTDAQQYVITANEDMR